MSHQTKTSRYYTCDFQPEADLSVRSINITVSGFDRSFLNCLKSPFFRRPCPPFNEKKKTDDNNQWRAQQGEVKPPPTPTLQIQRLPSSICSQSAEFYNISVASGTRKSLNYRIIQIYIYGPGETGLFRRISSPSNIPGHAPPGQ